VHLQPAVFRSLYDTPDFGMKLFAPWMPRWMKRISLSLGDRMVVDRMIAPALNDFRRELGLPPVRRLFVNWWHSPQLVIGAWPKWYAAPQPDWPAQTRLVGFVMYDAAGLRPMPVELETFLADCEQRGERAIVFTAGSAMRHGAGFFRTAAGACERLARPGVLITSRPEQLPLPLPAGVRQFDYAPFGGLFGRAAAVVHHGGMGTTAQAMRAGTPQLVVPFSHDQPDNAMRVKRLGLGERIAPKRFTPARAAELLARLIGDPQIGAANRKVADRFEGDRPVSRTCDLLEELFDCGAGKHSALSPG
jgi:rhamnosyltransferase subunit B